MLARSEELVGGLRYAILPVVLSIVAVRVCGNFQYRVTECLDSDR